MLARLARWILVLVVCVVGCGPKARGGATSGDPIVKEPPESAAVSAVVPESVPALPATVVVAETRHPYRLVTDADHLYWLGMYGGIGRTDLAGDALTMLLEPGEGDLCSELLSDEKFLYASCERPGAILRVAKDGSGTEELASSLPYVDDIALDDDALWFVHDFDVLRMPRTGGTAETVAVITRAGELVTDDLFVYVTSLDGIYRIPKSGGEPELLLEGDLTFFTFITLFEDHLYFLRDDFAVWRLPKGGGAPTRIVESDEADPVSSFAVAADGLYVVRGAFDEHELFFYPHDGSERTSRWSGRGYVASLSLTEDAVYFTENDYFRIWRVPRSVSKSPL